MLTDREWEQAEFKKLIHKLMENPTIAAMAQLYVNHQYEVQGRGQ